MKYCYRSDSLINQFLDQHLPFAKHYFKYTCFPLSIPSNHNLHSFTMRFEIIYALFATVAVALPRGGNQEVSIGI